MAKYRSKKRSHPSVRNNAQAGATRGEDKTPPIAKAAARPAEIESYFPSERRPLWPAAFLRAAGDPARIITRRWKGEIPHMGAVFALVFALYAYTAPRLVALEDDGLFIMNLDKFGVAHPPGYPFYTLLGAIFYHILPFGAPALKGHLFSSFAGAIACSALYATTAMLTRGRIFAYLAGLSFGASHTFWSQSIIAEVYALNAAMFFIMLALTLRYAAFWRGDIGRDRVRVFTALAIATGLALANHVPLILLGGTGLGIIVFSQLGDILRARRLLRGALIVLVAVAVPYAVMVWRSHSDSISLFYGPIDSIEDLLFYIARKGYAGVDKQANVDWTDKQAFIQILSQRMLWQYTPLGAALSLLGVFVMLRSRFNWICLGLLSTWFCSSYLLIALIDFQAEFIWFSAFRVYSLVSYGVMGIWLAVGAAWVADWGRRLSPQHGAQSIGFVLAVAVLGWQVTAHWKDNNRRDYRWAHDFATFKLNGLEPNAAFFSFDDLDVPVMYLNHVEEVRPDVEVYNDQGLVLANRLYSPLIPDHAPPNAPNIESKAKILRNYTNENGRPVYYHPQRIDLFRHPQFGSDFLGFYRKVNRESPSDRIILSDRLREWLDTNLAYERFTDDWTRHQHYNTVATLVNAIMIAAASGFEMSDEWREVIDRARDKNTLAHVISALQLWGRGFLDDDEKKRQEWEWTENRDLHGDEQLSAQGKSYFYLLRANLARDLFGEDDPRIVENLYQAVAQDPKQGNQALNPLLDRLFNDGDNCAFLDLVESHYPKASDIPPGLLSRVRSVRARGCENDKADKADNI